MTGSPVLVLRDLSFAYSQKLVFRNIHLSVGKGEVVGVLGPSGCGKSTLLKVAGSFLAPSSGEVIFRDLPVNIPDYRRIMVFQDTHQLFPWRTVEQNLAFAQGAKKDPERIIRALKEVRMEAYAHYYPYQLSGGMAQRTALARAFLGDPPLLLLDEPFGSVDALQRKELQALLQTLIRVHQTSALLVTHDLDEVQALSNRIFVLNGNLIEVPSHLPFAEARDFISRALTLETP